MEVITDKALVPALRFPEFTDVYKRAKIREVASLASGATPLRSKHQYFESGDIAWVKTTDLNNSFITKTEEKVTVLALKETSLKKQPAGSVLVAMYGGFNQIGRTGLLVEPATTNQALSVIKPKKEVLNSLYLLLWMNKSVLLWRKFAASSRKDPNITSSDVAAFPVVFSSLNEQQKIADFLTAVDTKIQQLKRKHSLMQQYKKGVMQQLFSQQVRFEDDDGRDYPDWEENLAGHVFLSHSNKKHDGDLPILAATQNRGMVYRDDIGIDIQSSEASVKSYKVVERGDFVISLRSFQGGIEYSGVTGICSPAYTILKPKVEVSNGFFKHYFKKDDFISRLSMTVVGIRDGKQISYSAFSGMKLKYPCLEEQRKIADFLGAIDAKTTQLNTQITQAETFKKGLLQQMFV